MTKKKGAKKRFFEVETPLTAAKVHLYSSGEDELDGRVVRLDLSRSLRGKGFELKFRVKFEEGKLRGEPMSLALVGSYVRRMMRKGADYVEDSFQAECKDAKFIVKPFFITRNKVSRAVRKVLRENAKKSLEGHMKNRSSDELFKEIMANKLQKELSLKLKKIYPLALCEIRVFEVVGVLEKGGGESAKKIEKEEEK